MLGTEPLVSVVISSYNHDRFVYDAVNSILGQSYSNFELLICDDCSDDSTYDIVDSFNDNRIKLYKNETNLGFVRTINNLLNFNTNNIRQIIIMK